MKKFVIAVAMIAGLATPAFAAQCPTLLIKIDEALKVTTVDDATKTQVMELYTKGKTEHEAGNHDASVTDLNAALALLGM